MVPLANASDPFLADYILAKAYYAIKHVSFVFYFLSQRSQRQIPVIGVEEQTTEVKRILCHCVNRQLPIRHKEMLLKESRLASS